MIDTTLLALSRETSKKEADWHEKKKKLCKLLNVVKTVQKTTVFI